MKWRSFDMINKSIRYKMAKRNYLRNKSIGIRIIDDEKAANIDAVVPKSKEALLHSTVCEVRGRKLLYCQYGGNFPLMKFVLADMGEVNCEIMAVYNAMKLSGYISDDEEFDEFFRISCEFEVNAPYITPTGHFGGSYKKIGDFLSSRNVSFEVCRDIDKIDEIISSSDCCIVSYRFDRIKVHTFCCFYENDELVSVNRGGTCLYLWRNDSLKECLRKRKFLVGYALKRKRE